MDALFKSPTRVPFYFKWIQRSMVVTQDFTPDHSLPRGTEILSIDGVQTSVILARLLSIARADGSNDNKRIAQLEVNGNSEYPTFDIYFPLFFPQKSTVMALRIRKPGSAKAEQIVVQPLTFEERIASIKKRDDQRKGSNDPQFEWKDLEDGSGYVRMPTWALYDSKWNWKEWLHVHIDGLVDRNAPALILDLRRNEGGNDIGNEIIPYLIDEPIRPSSMRRLVRYRKVPEDLVPYLDTWDKSFRDWGAAAVDLPAPWPTAPVEVPYLGHVRSDDDANGDVIKPGGKRFRGRVFVIIDANNSSATFQFAQNVHNHRLGTLVGQTTGGNQRGINGGAFFFLRLPHSGIEMDLPLIGTFPPSPAPNAGITPDLPITPTIGDIASGRDPELAAISRVFSQSDPYKRSRP